MNNVSSYCGLVVAKIRASDKDLPVHDGKQAHSAPMVPERKKSSNLLYKM